LEFLSVKVNWVLDADIRGFFDAISREWMLEFIRHRVGDPRVLRLIQKWLAAGVLENGKWARSKTGTPQGATISPLLGNIYLHYVFDLWAHQWRQRNARGDVVIVRYADDFAVGFQYQKDAEQFLEDLRERFQKFELELHSDKTRLIEFGRYAARDRERRGLGKPETFMFLGFVHICSKTKDGWFLLKRQTDGKRMSAKLKQLKSVLLRMRHVLIPVQGAWLQRVIRGYFNYHAVPTNIMALDRFRTEIAHH
jgi:group II intron reverse transcriptase/maturase